MAKARMKKRQPRWKRKPKRVPTSEQIFDQMGSLIPNKQKVFDRIEGADAAIKKLFLDEPLTDDEFDALMRSEYVRAPEDGPSVGEARQVSALYQQSKFGLAVASPILFSSIELEVLAYFGRYPELLYSLPPRKFEEIVAAVFRNNGFTVELTPETRDGGIDIVAVQKNSFGGSTLHLIECKRYLPENKVGIGIVQRMLGVVESIGRPEG